MFSMTITPGKKTLFLDLDGTVVDTHELTASTTSIPLARPA